MKESPLFQTDLLAGKKILVTGGGTGLGKSFAQRFVELGAHVVICGRRKQVLDETAQGLRAAVAGARVDTHACDVRDAGAVEAMMDAIWQAGPLDVLVNLTSMGTLIAFAIVSAGVIILRRTRPDLPRGYKVPLYPALPIASVAFCGYLILGLPWDTFALFGVWVAAACVIYFGYSRKHSKLA